MISLADPLFLFIGFIFIPLFIRKKAAFLGYSRLHLMEGHLGSWFFRLLPQFLFVMTIAFLVIGLARPQKNNVVTYERFLARDIILVVDLSYSMEDTFKNREGARKIDVAKNAARQFILKRENDRIGLLVFGDDTFGSWPLTRDLDLILKKVGRLGSTFYGGTDLAQPFLKALSHFRDMGQSESRVLVYLSDGKGRIPDTLEEKIIMEMNKMDTHFYLLGINISQEKNDLLEIVERTDGRFFVADSAGELRKAFEAIDLLEPSMVQIEIQGQVKELYLHSVFLALCLMLIWTILRQTLFIELS
jgi:Ca-activated chloride channel family protein